MGILIKNARIVNEGGCFVGDVLIKGQFIERVDKSIEATPGDTIIEAKEKFLIPGLIDDQVHFREPGLTHKATIFTESRAAVAGGITSFMEMPNTVPNTLTQDLLEAKYALGAKDSLANYSFFMGVSNDNIEEVLKTDVKNVCGIKVFMGSSTGNMLVDDEHTLHKLFSSAPTLIAAHCEDEATIRKNTEDFRRIYGEDVPIHLHPSIRSKEACYKSSSFARDLAMKTGARLHILHISTAKELELFRNDIPLKDKKITAEACIHHMWFENKDYEAKGSLIKWNPAVKTHKDKQAILEAVKSGRIDVIATDHAPHTLEEKQNTYFKAPSGGPLVQHSLVTMMEYFHQGLFTMEEIVEKMCHNPAILFEIDRRGYIREGYYADIVLVDPHKKWTVSKENILAQCGWSPFEGQEYQSTVTHTIVSGNLVYEEGKLIDKSRGMRLQFNR